MSTDIKPMFFLSCMFTLFIFTAALMALQENFANFILSMIFASTFFSVMLAVTEYDK